MLNKIWHTPHVCLKCCTALPTIVTKSIFYRLMKLLLVELYNRVTLAFDLVYT